VIYLVSAYASAAVLLGGYLLWSLRQLRQMEKRRPER
jgi:hypothetical protein